MISLTFTSKTESSIAADERPDSSLKLVTPSTGLSRAFRHRIKSLISWKTHLNVREGDLCIDNVKQGDLNLDREARGQLHVDEVLQLLEVSVGDR